MSSSNEIYVSFNPQVYRSGKAAGLASQAELLKMMKHIQNLKVLSRQRQDLRDKLNKLLESVAKNIYSLEKKFPSPEVPKKFKHSRPKSKKEKVIDDLDIKIPRDYSKRDHIESELLEIQKKLQALNS